MKKDPIIREAIDESLVSVHFDARDMHAVLRAVRSERAPDRAPKRRMRLNFAFAAAMLLLIAVPVLTLRTAGTPPDDITTIAAEGESTPLPTASEAPPQSAAALDETEAIRLARACFEAQCDTSVFTFDEYTVSVQGYAVYGSSLECPDYEVSMKSIYDNGCTFTVVISAQDGSVVSFSDPALATVPAAVSSDSPEVQSWYEKYGEDVSAWPQEALREFARRYGNGLLNAEAQPQ